MRRLMPLATGATLLIPTLLLAQGSSTRTPARAPQPDPKTPPAPLALAPAQFPPFQEATLPNGLRLLVVENRKQPVISISLSFAAGAVREPATRRGLAGMMAGLLSKGAGTRSADDFAAAIEGVGGGFSASAGDDFLGLYVNTLSRDAELAFSLLADATMRPTFPASEVELLRTQTLSNIQLSKSQPAAIAGRLYQRAIYGAHPYGADADEASVKAITREDIVAFHKAQLRPQGALLVVAGAMNLATAKALATKVFAGWSGAPAAAPALPAVPSRSTNELILVHRPGSVQSNVIIGNTTWLPNDPRSYAATVINAVLGGGSEGRFFRILREEKGWTYGSYSGLTRKRGLGNFQATGEFRTEVTDSAVKVMLAQIRELRTQPVPMDEFTKRKGSLTGRFPLTVETAEQVAGQVATARLYGLPTDYVATYRQKLSAVTPASAQAAAAAAFQPDKGVILVVGDAAKLYDKLQGIATTLRLVDVDGKPLTPADLKPKASTLSLNFASLVPMADSFVVKLQGNPFGYQTARLEADGDGWRYTEKTVLGPVINQTSVVTFSATGVMRTSKQNGTVQGQEALIDVTYANGKATGKSKTPSQQGPVEITVNSEVPAGALDDNVVPAFMPIMPFAANAKIPFTVFQSGKGSAKNSGITVLGEEEVTVPAGTFKTYKATIDGAEQPTFFYVTVAAPHRLVKIALQGAPIEIVLAK